MAYSVIRNVICVVLSVNFLWLNFIGCGRLCKITMKLTFRLLYLNKDLFIDLSLRSTGQNLAIWDTQLYITVTFESILLHLFSFEILVGFS